MKANFIMIGMLCGLFLQTGCILNDTPEDKQSWDIDAPEYKYDKVTLSMTNDGDKSVFNATTLPFLKIYDGDQLVSLSEPFCNCTNQCPLGLSRINELLPFYTGQTQTQVWDGTYWAQATDGCSVQRKFKQGKTLDAEFCYGERSAVGRLYDAYLDKPTCKKVPFTLGDDKTVKHSISPTWVEPFEIEIVNKTEALLEFAQPRGCDGDYWLTVNQDNDANSEFEPLPLLANCELKTCAESGPKTTACDFTEACEQPEMVGPTQTKVLTWNERVFLPLSAYNENSCQIEQLAPAGKTEISICFRRTLPIVNGRQGAIECMSKEIELGTTRSVSFEVK